MTPEGEVKRIVRQMLQTYRAFYFMPVQTGYGAPALDFICYTSLGHPFWLETKAPGRTPTVRQVLLAKKLLEVRVPVFLIDNCTMDDIHYFTLHRFIDEKNVLDSGIPYGSLGQLARKLWDSKWSKYDRRK